MSLLLRLCYIFKKVPFLTSFSLYLPFLQTVNPCSKKVADDCTRTADLWYWKRPLCHLCHKHCHCVIIVKNGPFPASFCLFPSFSHSNSKNTKLKKHRWCAWNSNPGCKMVGADGTSQLRPARVLYL